MTYNMNPMPHLKQRHRRWPITWPQSHTLNRDNHEGGKGLISFNMFVLFIKCVLLIEIMYPLCFVHTAKYTLWMYKFIKTPFPINMWKYIHILLDYYYYTQGHWFYWMTLQLKVKGKVILPSFPGNVPYWLAWLVYGI